MRSSATQPVESLRGEGPLATPPSLGAARRWRVRVPSADSAPKVIAGLVILLIAILVAFVVYMTFVPTLPTQIGFTISHWTEVFNARLISRVVPNTLLMAVVAVIVATCFAVPMAWYVGRTAVPLRSYWVSQLMIVAVVPGYALAMGWILLLDGQIGILNHAYESITGATLSYSVTGSIVGIGWVMGLLLTPAMFFLIATPIASIDPSLGECAAVCGSTGFKSLLRIDLPLIRPAILGGLIYIFMSAASIFEIPALLGAASGKTPVLATELFYSVLPHGPTGTPGYGSAGVYGFLLSAPSLIALWFYLRVLQRAERYEVVTGRGYRQTPAPLSLVKKIVAFVVMGGYGLCAVVLPAAVLVWVSLLPYLQVPSVKAFDSITGANYSDMVVNLGGTGVIWNTVKLAAIVGFLVVVCSFAISWVVVRSGSRFRKVVDMLAMVPHAVPGLAFAFALAMIGIIFAVHVPIIPLSGTLAIIVIAHVVNRIPYGTRLMNGALIQLNVELEEAAVICGARPLSVLRRVTLPLIRPALIYLGVWTALLSFQEVSMALFLSGPNNTVLSVSIWNMWTGGNVGNAAAAMCAIIAVQACLLVVFFSLRRTRSAGAVSV